jgi:hypothetical protein
VGAPGTPSCMPGTRCHCGDFAVWPSRDRALARKRPPDPEHVSGCSAERSARCVFRVGHASGTCRAMFVAVAVFVALLTVMGVIYYLIRLRRHPEEETRPPE